MSGSGRKRESGRGAAKVAPPSLFWAGMAGLAALLFVGLAAVLEMAPTAPTGPDAPPEAFSAARAMTHISAIADEPRPVGSAQHAEARAYLLDSLARLGGVLRCRNRSGCSTLVGRHPVDCRGRQRDRDEDRAPLRPGPFFWRPITTRWSVAGRRR